MKRVIFTVGFLLAISFSFLIVDNNMAIGQTTTIAKTCTELQSSQAFYFNICSDNGYDNVCFDKFTSIYQGCIKNTYNDCTVYNGNATQNILCSVTATSDGTVTLSPKFTGIWKIKVNTDDSSSSNIITLKLCVKEGKLEGIVHQGGAFLNGVITEQTIISENEVEFTAQSQDNKTAKIKLNLIGDRQFQAILTDGHILEGRKLNENRGCSL